MRQEAPRNVSNILPILTTNQTTVSSDYVMMCDVSVSLRDYFIGLEIFELFKYQI